MFSLALEVNNDLTQSRVSKFLILGEDFEEIINRTYDECLVSLISDLQVLLDEQSQILMGDIHLSIVFNALDRREEAYEMINLSIADIDEIIIILESIFVNILSNLQKALAFPKDGDLKEFNPIEETYELDYQSFLIASKDFLLQEYRKLAQELTPKEILFKIEEYLRSKDLNEYLQIIENDGFDWDFNSKRFFNKKEEN